MAQIPKYRDEAAFPRAAEYREPKPDEVLLPAQWGLSKREYFAVEALKGLLASGQIEVSNINGAVPVAIYAADRLLCELAKKS
jgi:hypothetical protein